MNVITSIDGLPIKNGGSFHGNVYFISERRTDPPWRKGPPRRFDLLAGGSRTKAGIVGTHRGPGGGRPGEIAKLNGVDF